MSGQPALHKMAFAMLDGQVDAVVDRTRKELMPFLMEIKERLSAQGRRSDLHRDTPNLTWTEWKESKREKLGLASRSIDQLLATGSTTRPSRQLSALKAEGSELSLDEENDDVPASALAEYFTGPGAGMGASVPRTEKVPDINEVGISVARRIYGVLAEGAARREDRELFDQVTVLLQYKDAVTTSRRSLTVELEELSTRALALRAQFKQQESSE
jgi:hypothetical protein